jgi:hypothetical protein
VKSVQSVSSVHGECTPLLMSLRISSVSRDLYAGRGGGVAGYSDVRLTLNNLISLKIYISCIEFDSQALMMLYQLQKWFNCQVCCEKQQVRGSEKMPYIG